MSANVLPAKRPGGHEREVALVCRALVVTSESTHVVLRLYLGQLVGWLVDVTIQSRVDKPMVDDPGAHY